MMLDSLHLVHCSTINTRTQSTPIKPHRIPRYTHPRAIITIPPPTSVIMLNPTFHLLLLSLLIHCSLIHSQTLSNCNENDQTAGCKLDIQVLTPQNFNNTFTMMSARYPSMVPFGTELRWYRWFDRNEGGYSANLTVCTSALNEMAIENPHGAPSYFARLWSDRSAFEVRQSFRGDTVSGGRIRFGVLSSANSNTVPSISSLLLLVLVSSFILSSSTLYGATCEVLSSVIVHSTSYIHQ